MKKYFFIFLFLTGCSSDKITKIEVHPPDFIKKDLINLCTDKQKINAWMELTEHHHFRCTYNRDNHNCYGWIINAYVTCEVKNIGYQTFKYNRAVSYGNTDLKIDR